MFQGTAYASKLMASEIDKERRQGRGGGPSLDLRLWIMPSMVALLLVVAVYTLSPNFRWSPGPQASPYAGDFVHDWLGGYVFWTGQGDRICDVEFIQQLQHSPAVLGYHWDKNKYFPLVYPPFYYVIVSPFSLFPFHVAAWMWAAVMALCLPAAIVLLVLHGQHELSETNRSEKIIKILPWTLPVSLLYMPVIESLTSNQKATVCLLILTATFVLMNRKQPFWAGVVFGLLAFKPQLTLVIGAAMLLKLQWRFLWGGMFTGGVLLTLSLFAGADWCVGFMAFGAGAGGYIRTAGYDLTKSHCLYGFFALLCQEALPTEKWVTSLAAIGVVWLLCRIFRGKLRPGSTRFSLQFSALVLGTVLLSPHLMTYDLSILLLPMFLLRLTLFEKDRETIPSPTYLIWLLALTFTTPCLSMSIAAATNIQVSVLLLLALLISLERLCAYGPISGVFTGFEESVLRKLFNTKHPNL